MFNDRPDSARLEIFAYAIADDKLVTKVSMFLVKLKENLIYLAG